MNVNLVLSDRNKRYIARIPISELYIDRSYQRIIKQRRIKEITDNFDPELFGILDVNRRGDGKYYIFDGGHRREVAEILGIKELECRVREGMSAEEEAQLFVKLNSNRGRVTALETFNAKLKYGDKGALRLRELLLKHGITVAASGNTKNTIQAVGQVERVIRDLGESVLDKTLYVLRGAYNGDPASLGGQVIRGVSIFVNKYYKEIDYRRLAYILSMTPVSDIMRDGHAYSRTFGNAADGIGRSLLSRYNARLRDKNKLPAW